MTQRRVSVIGGGAGGLFTARLLARRHPDWRITVYERMEPSGTFGFGIGLTGALLTAIDAVDPDTRLALEHAATTFSTAEFRLPDGSVMIPGFHRGLSIARSELLTILVRQAESAGVEVCVGEAADVARLAPVSDLVVAADGVSSASRGRYAEGFGPTVDEGRGVYLWCGSELSLDGTVFAPVYTRDGVFTAHAYPYAPGRSTFVIESDAESLAKAGLDTFDPAGAAVGASDERSLEYLTEAFQPLLQGHKFLGNKSVWFRFRTVRCRSWVHDNVVLVGDAAATADPSLGSGTKLAMESAIALAVSLDEYGRAPLTECLRTFDRTRRPAVERLQGWAARSQRWWDSFPPRLDHVERVRVPVSFLTRAGAVSLDKALAVSPDMIRRAVAAWAGVPEEEVPHSGISDWVIGRPAVLGGVELPGGVLPIGEPGLRERFTEPLEVQTGDAWCAETDALVHRARELTEGDADRAVLLTGCADRESVLDRLEVAERVRHEVGRPVAVTAPAGGEEDLAAALVAGRIDLVCREAEPTPAR